MGKYKDLIVLSAPEHGDKSEFHEEFTKTAAIKVHDYMGFILDLASRSRACAPCAILSMISTLMANMFVLFEAKSGSGDCLSEILHDMVDHAKKIAKLVLITVLTTAKPNVVDMERGSVGSAYASRHAPRPHTVGSKRPWV
ncbi:MAG: hypothetical protein IIB38_15995 [Candidatus Hydrogenedentes bacterium]|nr:hypothetical protein [Candidatus Hydrogenedentota bacterium]